MNQTLLTVVIVVVMAVMLAGALYLRKTLPWPFRYEGKKYRRMPDGSFQDAGKATVTDQAMMPVLQEAYEAAKYGRRDLSDMPDASGD